MPNSTRVPLSILDLAFVREGETAREALQDSRALARHADAWGYKRFWMAEHHNMEGIASAATAVALAYVGERTERIRIGSGGIMLPNHSPLVIAEQFGTLASLYPGRVDLGLWSSTRHRYANRTRPSQSSSRFCRCLSRRCPRIADLLRKRRTRANGACLPR